MTSFLASRRLAALLALAVGAAGCTTVVQWTWYLEGGASGDASASTDGTSSSETGTEVDAVVGPDGGPDEGTSMDVVHAEVVGPDTPVPVSCDRTAACPTGFCCGRFDGATALVCIADNDS